ncbi:MAG: glycolate oxidase subunit GlcE [Betaproteobacteria bacterium]|nr:glycolate oxidase subunit GlcE [Betaproteobacteria bacterium]
MHDLVTEWSERIREAAAAGEPLCIRAGGSKDFYGGIRQGALLDTSDYRGIVEYEPTELVLIARAGTPLAEIEHALAERDQMLAFEPPHLGPAATLGGAIACGLSGPRRAAAGSARDFVLGARILDGRGDELAFGGKVMKNVAGYDVSRLMVGAMGTLGLLLDVSLKVLPEPAHELTLRFELDQAAAIRRMNEWAARPYAISATCHEERVLAIRLSGTQAGVEALARQLGGERVPDSAEFWRAVREQQCSFFRGAATLWRLSVKSTAPALALAGPQLLEWNGALRWVRTDADPVEVRKLAHKAGGHATWYRGAAERANVFHPLAEPLMRLHRRLKQTFDPAGVLNRGRLYPDL